MDTEEFHNGDELSALLSESEIIEAVNKHCIVRIGVSLSVMGLLDMVRMPISYRLSTGTAWPQDPEEKHFVVFPTIRIVKELCALLRQALDRNDREQSERIWNAIKPFWEFLSHYEESAGIALKKERLLPPSLDSSDLGEMQDARNTLAYICNYPDFAAFFARVERGRMKFPSSEFLTQSELF